MTIILLRKCRSVKKNDVRPSLGVIYSNVKRNVTNHVGVADVLVTRTKSIFAEGCRAVAPRFPLPQQDREHVKQPEQ
jgi:hypothetical protein